ncbi:hypothetical protein [Azospirillum palustre]
MFFGGTDSRYRSIRDAEEWNTHVGCSAAKVELCYFELESLPDFHTK